MTEKMKTTEFRKIHWMGFAISLIASPMLISAAIMVPLAVFEMFDGGRNIREMMTLMRILITIGVTLYIVIGTPVLIWHLRRNAPDTGRIMMLSLVSLLWMVPMGALFAIAIMDLSAFFFAAISMCLGLIGAPPLAALFTVIYKRFDRD